MPIRVPLRYTRLVSRQPYIELDGPAFRLRLPWIFDEIWNLNAADVAVVVVADQSIGGDDSGNGWVFEVPICIPYAATEHPTSKPNLMLLFKTPQRIPPLRPSGAKAIGWSSFTARGSAGIQIDGLELHAQDPHAAGVTLAFAGLERVDRPNLWLRHHRRVTQDPCLVQAAETTGRARQSGTVSGRQVSAGGRAVGGPAKRRRVGLSLFIGVAIAAAGQHLLPWVMAHVTGTPY